MLTPRFFFRSLAATDNNHGGLYLEIKAKGDKKFFQL